MSKYRISAEDLKYAEEFRADPLGIPGPGLQRVQNLLRGGPKSGKYVLIVKEPFKRWGLGRLPTNRGEPIEILDDWEFTDLAEAEWEVFKLRWMSHTGQDLEQAFK